MRASLLQGLVDLAKLPDLALQCLDPVLLDARQPGPQPGITFGLLAPGAQAVWRAAQLRGNRTVGNNVAGVFATMVAEKPNVALAKFGKIGGVKLCFVIGLILRVFYSPINPLRLRDYLATLPKGGRFILAKILHNHSASEQFKKRLKRLVRGLELCMGRAVLFLTDGATLLRGSLQTPAAQMPSTVCHRPKDPSVGPEISSTSQPEKRIKGSAES